MYKKFLFILTLLPILALGVLAQDDAEMPTMRLWASFNPAGLENDGLGVIALDLSQIERTLTGAQGYVSIESVAFNAAGDGYVTLDYAVDANNAPTAGALMVIPALANTEAASLTDLADSARLIAGDNTGLLTPEGLHIIDELGLVLVADAGAKKVFGWPLNAEGDSAPVLVLNGGEGRALWDIWYDRGNDILYGAGTDGVAVAYDLFSDTVFAIAADGQADEVSPTRFITPTDADGNKISVNLHGIDIDYDNNLLILTDVGDAAVADDGQIFTIAVASLADGPTAVTARIYGDQTVLGNPVDVIFDLETGGIYVAEKAKDAVLFYADVNSLSGDLNVPADITLAATKPGSVDLYPPRAFANGMSMILGK
jgi:hypothetical protein